MPQIMVTTTTFAGPCDHGVVLQERVTLEDLESEHFARQLVERLRWALGDSRDTEPLPSGKVTRSRRRRDAPQSTTVVTQ